MSQPDFESLLLREVAPVLAAAGYAYDPRLREGVELFGLRKALTAETQAIVQFQRRLTTGEFTVNLLRVSANPIGPRVYGGSAEAGGARLSYVLWYVYELRAYSASDWWWQPDAESLRDVAEQLMRYGLRWLEDPAASKPWEMPVQRNQEFVQAAQAILSEILLSAGFHWQQLRLAGDVPYLYAVKPLAVGTYAIIEVQPTYSLDPAEFTFDVCLQRAAVPNPLSGRGARVSLAQLRAPSCDVSNDDPQAAISAVKALLWRYADRAELDAQLRDVAICLREFGLAWFAQSSIEA